tara:strand:+ start:199 stop:1842 length:1644 start_codon:yes stop_codon:yes gene_type:complete
MSEYSIFPKALDGYAQLPLAVDKRSPINAESVNRLRSAIVNIEKTLGAGVIDSELYGQFVDLRNRLNSIEGFSNSVANELYELTERLEFQSDFEALYQELKDTLIQMFEELDLNEILEIPDETLTSLYLKDPKIELAENPLVIKKDSVSGAFDISGDHLNLGIEGATYAWFFPEVPLSSSLVLKSEPTPLALGEADEEDLEMAISFSSYLNLEEGLGDSPFSIYRLHADSFEVPGGLSESVDSVHLAFGMNRGKPDAEGPKRFSVQMGVYDAIAPGMDGGSIAIEAGGCASGNDGGNIRLRAGKIGQGWGSSVDLKPAGEGLEIRGGDPDEDPSYAVPPRLWFTNHTSSEGGRVYLDAGRAEDFGGFLSLHAGEGRLTGGNIHIQSGRAEKDTGSIVIETGAFLGTGYYEDRERGSIALFAKDITLDPDEKVIVKKSLDARTAKTKLGAIFGNVRTIMASDFVEDDDHTIVCSAVPNISLGLPIEAEVGRILYVKNLSSTGSVDINDTENFNGIDNTTSTLTLPGQGDYAQLQKASANKWIVLATSV